MQSEGEGHDIQPQSFGCKLIHQIPHVAIDGSNQSIGNVDPLQSNWILLHRAESNQSKREVVLNSIVIDLMIMPGPGEAGAT